MSKAKWKPGDIVRLIEAKRFVRVGYPLNLPAVAEDIAENRLEQLYAAMAAFGLPMGNSLGGLRTQLRRSRITDRLANAFAYAEIAYKGFGGRVRSIHEEEFDNKRRWTNHMPFADRRFVVVNKFHVMTGEYYGPSGDYESYESGGLDKQKHNTILVLEIWWPGREKYFNLEERRTTARLPRNELIKQYDCVWDIRAEKVGCIPQTKS